MTDKTFAPAHWTVEDVHQARSDNRPAWSDEEAVEFLEGIEDRLTEAMITAGGKVIEAELGGTHERTSATQ